MPRYFLGFDAGGTKTTCALADDSRVLAREVGGSIKPLRVTIEHARQNLSALLGEISRQSGVDLRKISASCVGTAGVRLPQTDGWMRQILSACAGGEIVVCGDEEIALDAAFPGEAGVLAMAGTGSNVMGRTGQGEMLNVGGWGPALGDQASGHWIGLQSLRYACRARDFGQRTQILDRVIDYWSAGSIEEVVNIGNRTPPPDFSQLAPIVVECAEQGDAVSRQVLELGGRLLGEDAAEAFRHVRKLDPDTPLPGIAFTGSILEKVSYVRQSMIDTIRRRLPQVQILPEAVDPIDGALWRARQAVKT
ncbi:MAG TPA: BadF/BadG/BcrA/BcrD ATPase family protein [Silvibacterium sp.]|jgi:N-acetylglucosamine kinase-like BadF-type ATPase|nr:BadF/BadG/BcrA/BcrD ATPase family protein [Silvibacterium sp.]